MPELDFQVTGAEAVSRSVTPLMQFKVRISTSSGEPIQGVLLQAQIQFQCPRRAYTPQEKQKLFDLFGTPEQWGQTLRNRLWTHAQATVGAFERNIETVLPVTCTFDLNVAATKFFYGLEHGDVPLLFLFSGSVFYTAGDGRLQVQRLSWDKECSYRMPLGLWRELMQQHYPNSAWLCLRRDIFDRLYAFKRQQGAASWDEVLERLLPGEPAAPALRPEAVMEVAS